MHFMTNHLSLEWPSSILQVPPVSLLLVSVELPLHIEKEDINMGSEGGRRKRYLFWLSLS